MIRILVDSNIPFIRGLLEPVAAVSYLTADMFSRERLSGFDAIIIRTRTSCNESLLKDTPVRFIGTATIGTDHIDTDWCKSNGIRVANAPGCNAGAVMQYIIAALLFLENKHLFNIKDKTLGIIGAGNVGRKVIKAAKAIGMKVLINDPPRERTEGTDGFVSLQTLASESDIISFHTPLTLDGPDPTWHLGDKRFFDSFKKNSFIINSSRGGVIDEKSLIKAIINNRVKGAVIDTWEGEPFINHKLLTICDVTTPHIAGYSVEGKHNATQAIINSLANFFNLDINLIMRPSSLPEAQEIYIKGNTPGMSGSPEITSEGKTIFIEDNHDDHKVLNRIVRSTYEIKKDSCELRSSPDLFEQIRNNYPVRREFSAYSVKVCPAKQNLASALDLLGFRIR